VHANTFLKLTLGGNAETIASEEAASQARAAKEAESQLRLDRIMVVKGANISLKTIPKRPADAVVTLMLGHQNLRNNPHVGGGDIVDGFNASGRSIERVDHLMRICRRHGYVTATGKNRGRRYELTAAGVQRAEEVAHALIAGLSRS
jgi:hypothetical protein